MNEPMTHEERVARALADRLRRDPEKLAIFLAPPPDSRRARGKDERELFWLRDEHEDEQALWDEFGKVAMEQNIPPDEAIEMSRNAIAARLYPHRLAVIKAGERSISPRKQIEFVQRMIRQGPPTPKVAFVPNAEPAMIEEEGDDGGTAEPMG